MLKKIFTGTELFKNISTLVTGTLLAQLVPILLQTILRRTYPAEDFGAFAVFLSVTSILMVAASFRYEMSIVLPDKRADSVNIVFAATFASLLFNLLLLGAVWGFSDSFLLFLNLGSEYRFVLFWIPASTFLFSSYQIMNYYLVRYKRYRSISINKISRRISEGAGQTAAGFAGFYSTGLIIGNILGHLVNNLSGIIQIMKSDFSLRLFSWRRQWEVMLKYRDFPMYNMIPALLNAICMHLPLILVNKFYNQETAAYFDLSRQVLVLPASILALSISQVMLQNISEKRRKQESFLSDLKKILLLLSIPAAGLFVVFSIWAPTLFRLYAGAEYSTSGEIARILVAGASLKLIVSPVSSIFAAIGKIKVVSLWHTFYFLLISSLFLFKDLDIFSFLRLYLAIDLLAYSILLFLIFSVSRSYEKKLINS